ncbi:hypothetical protein BT67DRAFT_398106 [Trichocladium antarcticum]|uniref:Casein kinase II beta 2 subunit n=1 Tax=Trichocladium antarcticum TaxID=1450529 RepID=A0AAN6UPY2_9PEZI|nr:hypothetical protein BT67DRAFT_398106 [Trichocladium antarcticum]
MSPAGGIWAAATLRALRQHLASSAQMASRMLRTKLAAAARPLAGAKLQPILVRTGRARQPVHPAAWLRQQKRAGRAKWYSTSHINAAVRRFITTNNSAASPSARGVRLDRSKPPTSNTARAVAQLTGRAPFASTLRPNLTGGALPRSAGGYGLGAGSARHFSHTPCAPAQVVQSVSQAMRAFWLAGQRARFDGVGANGEKRYRALSAQQDEGRGRVARALHARRGQPGAFVDFQISPAVTALSPLGAVLPFTAEDEFCGTGVGSGAATLHTEGFLDVLSVDFARALSDLAAVMTDLKGLAGLGDLPVLLEKNGVLRVRFPGVDADTVERLCDDVGVKRGVVGQDPDFDASAGVAVALRFPYAPDASCEDVLTSPGGSLRSIGSGSSEVEEAYFVDEFEENPWRLSSEEPEEPEEGYESMSPPALSSSGEHCSEEFDGLEGIHRFLEECDRARGRF